MKYTALPGRDTTGKAGDRGDLFGREFATFHFDNMLLHVVAIR